MDMRKFRLGGWALVWMIGCALWWYSGEPTATAASINWTVPPAPPLLLSPNFECSEGFIPGLNPIGEAILVPTGWTLIFLNNSSPIVSSTRRFYSNDCNPSSSQFIERLQGNDSLLVRSQDIETPPAPGKPFDVVLYQRVPATYGGAYSLSGWMVTLCGNKSKPFDCPPDVYIVKAIGIDPEGGTDPNAKSIEWVENHANFVDANGDRVGWQNLYTSATALTDFITVFARMSSSFQFHGNLGFMDAFSLIRAPLSEMEELPKKVEGTGELELHWIGEQSADVRVIPSGTHELLFDVQSRALPNGEWRDVVVGVTTESTIFRAPCDDTSYQFRVRARAEQPPAPPEGAFPNHRYPGVWTKPQTVMFSAPVTETLAPTQIITPTLYMPITARTSIRVC